MTKYNKNILITGGAGFIGSNFINYFALKYPQYKIINLDKLSYAADLNNLDAAQNLDNYKFIQGDICDVALLEMIFSQENISDVIHFAAESHVDNSIKSPREFIQTNIVGTFNLLEQFSKINNLEARFHHISTDEVYGSLGETGYFTEQTPYSPNSPYSASKASSDFIVRSFFHTFAKNVVTSNCSNNYGPRQHSEKLIPTIIKKCLNQQNIPIYGNGKNVRDWLFVEDHVRAIDLIFHQGVAGETYNVGGNNEYNNLEIAKTVCEILDELKPRAKGKYFDLVEFITDRAGHDFRYAIDCTKLQQQLGFTATETFTSGIRKTVEWYLKN